MLAECDNVTASTATSILSNRHGSAPSLAFATQRPLSTQPRAARDAPLLLTPVVGRRWVEPPHRGSGSGHGQAGSAQQKWSAGEAGRKGGREGRE
eukprot:1435035-Rhodomonas_salina.1